MHTPRRLFAHLLRPRPRATAHPHPHPQAAARRRAASRLATLTSRPFWLSILTQYRSAMKLALALNVGVLGTQAAIHATLHHLEEAAHPTPDAWPALARYYLRRARIPNAWNPLGEPQGDEAVKLYLDRALAAAEEAPGGVAWREGVLAVRRERGEWCERNRLFEDAEKEYRAGLDLDLPVGVGVGHRVAVAGRLAKILEWKGETAGALAVLEGAVEAAGGGSGLPPIGSSENTAPLLAAVTEVAVWKARRGDLGAALETMTGVLARREAAGRPADSRRFTTEIGDVCAVAATRAMIGELMFAIGKRKEGVEWTREAYETAWKDAEYRLACKECAGVAAENLMTMGEILEREGEEEEKKKGGWLEIASKRKRLAEEKKMEGEMLKIEFGYRKLEVEAVKAVRDAEIATARR